MINLNKITISEVSKDPENNPYLFSDKTLEDIIKIRDKIDDLENTMAQKKNVRQPEIKEKQP